jgi:hypothetical protein
MGKLVKPAETKAAVPSKALPKNAAKALPSRKGMDAAIMDSDMMDASNSFARLFVITGLIGAGTTFFAASASDKWKGAPPFKSKVRLDDCLWGLTDADGVKGFQHNNISVPTFDFFRFMSVPAVYKTAGFSSAPNLFASIKYFLNQCQKHCEVVLAQGRRPKIIIDTLSSLDEESITHFHKECLNHTNKYEAYKRNLVHHRILLSDLRKFQADVFLLCHMTVAGEDSTQDQDKAVKTKVAMGGQYVIDITGKSAGLYKRHTSYVLVIDATKEKVGGKYAAKRRVLAGLNDKNFESKNRSAGLLPDVVEPATMQEVYKYIGG